MAKAIEICPHKARLVEAERRAREVLEAEGFSAELAESAPLNVLLEAFASYGRHIQCPVQQLAGALRHSLEGLVEMELQRVRTRYGLRIDWRQRWREAEPESYSQVSSAQVLLMNLFTAELKREAV